MNYTVSLSEAAINDLKNAHNWYSDKSTKIGEHFEVEISDSINLISENPLKYQIRYQEIRVKFLSHFPYGIHFRIHQDEIIIIGVYHMHISPTTWTKRK